ncbi:MAG: ATP-binding protein [Symploca sp. SIO3C6]|uniref:ATP-binding protein n=1 Tax=Symploca sp. SIO1C4 TaxID=2607765 RepID=A0A6B3NCI0_9CYAN|nr:ATP-binding protein [Symploca sp. SIO3C6]NER29300.1 ATP-binding protein [Symploca sp. SIO1C4]NET03850.1 ATP-binding protein [Symploca sp. SIO2B6]NET49240.1 ATP-binding protein [Merismopedia sp. SIO2A8]
MKTELHIPSDLKFLTVVESWLLGSLKVGLSDSVDCQHQFNRLRLALVEAYSNVVRHAHQDQPHLPVLIRLELRGQEVALEIWDYGQGFDLSTYLPPNPSDKQISGYGWLIMKRLMDRVEYRLQDSRDGRNCLRLETSLRDESNL